MERDLYAYARAYAAQEAAKERERCRMICVARQAIAVVRPDGSFVIDSQWDERLCWVHMLGWPTVGEVKQAKRDGWRCVRVTVDVPDDPALDTVPCHVPPLRT